MLARAICEHNGILPGDVEEGWHAAEKRRQSLQNYGNVVDNEAARRDHEWLVRQRVRDLDADAAYRTPPKLPHKQATNEYVRGMHDWPFDDSRNIPRRLADKHLLSRVPLSNSNANLGQVSHAAAGLYAGSSPAGYAPLYFKTDGPSVRECRGEDAYQFSEWQFLSLSADPASWTMVGENEYAATLTTEAERKRRG